MSTQSKELTAFYQSYAKWLDEGAPEGKPYSREEGLCAAVDLFTPDSEVWDEMAEQFENGGFARGSDFPFNPIAGDYNSECQTASIHLNPDRIEWVREHAQ